jgi:hypothetical protein
MLISALAEIDKKVSNANNIFYMVLIIDVDRFYLITSAS